MRVLYTIRERLRRFARSRFAAIALFVLLFLLGMGLPSLAHGKPEYSIAQAQSRPEILEQQGRDLYKTEQFTEAIAQWQQAERLFRATGDGVRQAIVLSHLSLAYQELGQWQDAASTVQAAIALLQPDATGDESRERSPILAQVLDVLGRLQLSRGQAEAALTTWRRAEGLYQEHQSVEQDRLLRNRVNQAQALQSLGLYRQAGEALTEISKALADQPNSLLKADGLRSLGNVLRVTGDLTASQQVLQQSLTVAEAIADLEAIAHALFSLGYTARIQSDLVAAFSYYQRIIDDPAPDELKIAAHLRQINLILTADPKLVEITPDTNQLELSSRLLQLQSPIDALPLSRTKVYHRIDLADTLIKLERNDVLAPSFSPRPLSTSLLSPAAELLATALQESRTLADVRVESYALGIWGSLYEQTQQWTEAETLTQQALAIAQSINALDLSYQWQWQLGRILVTRSGIDLTTGVLPSELDEGNYLQAIAAYDQAVNTLQALRSDLAAIHPEAQYSFRDRVEPIYRQYIDLLLRLPEPSQENLQRARSTIEALQLAELDNFLREACLAPRQQIDQVIDEQDQTAAVIYAILLENRLEMVLKLPRQPLRHYATTISQTYVETTLNQLLQDLKEPAVASILNRAQARSQEVYNWLIQPIAMDLQDSTIETLVFVLDGVLRSVPMAALYDGEHYLIESYNIALTPGLQLVEPQPLSNQRLELLAAGISEERSNYPALKFVEAELDQIQTELPSQVLLNQQFTSQALQAQLTTHPFSVVHLATHGKFSSNPDETIILTWDRELPANQLDTFLQTRDQSQIKALELLVLSACETAQGDNRAVLGLSGIAVRAGARSAIASLWLADDEATALLMKEFYAALTDRSLNRAAALRQAQLKLLQGDYPQPRYWAVFILLGSWL